ncbi:MAG: T9SS type A sorting domain-containing protein [Lewinellaceae bacterium]|nr:T9SS type A sorting domain-containing protein [Lewinellaceae bacterium]
MKQIIFLFLFSAPLLLRAQQKPTPVHVSPDAPAWMQMMLADNPNVFEIQKNYSEYFENHAFTKNVYTQFYKRWMHWARPYTQADGSLHEPTVDEMGAAENTRKNIRSSKPDAAKKNDPGLGFIANWTFLGPNQTYDTDGVTEVTWQTNIYSLDIAPANSNVLYAGGESGGLWKTTNKGLNWNLLTINVLHGSFGAVKIHPADPNTVYAATGGKIIKTTDGGDNWTAVYSENNLWVNEIAIKSDNPNIVLAASDQGLLYTNNGGANWTKIHTQQTWTVKYKPGNPGTAFAVRKNGAGSDFLVSVDGGATFSPSNTGWWAPGQGESVTGAIIAVCPTNPSKLYTYLCGSGANLMRYIGVFVSTNNGASWSNTNAQNAVGNSPVAYSIPAHTNLMNSDGASEGFDQGFYDMAIIVNPNNDNQLIAGGTSWFKSLNGGATWTALGSYVGGLPWSHPDIQALAAAGNDLWIASDGGLNYSTNFAQTIAARMNGISGADLWGFDSGWNEDVLVGGRYHNGNMAWHESFPPGKFYRMGGAESATGYVNPGDARKTYFSDIGGYRLNGGFSNGVNAFSVGLFPNESYAYYANSEMVFDPRCWNHVYIGFENKIWKSTDGGTSYSALYTFPGNSDRQIYDIEVCRSNPDVLYCSQWDGADDAMWRSADGGNSWVQLTNLPLPNNNDRVKMAVDAENENVLWVAVTYGSNGKKIYKSVDGGQSWENLTTSTLNGIRITNIMAQYGTDGGIYLGTDAGVFYRNNSLADWQAFSDGLPLSAETNRLKPFYKNGKIRNGCWGFGVWESDLYESSKPVAQAMCSALESGCARDTVYFDDYSAVRHDGASWVWQFPGAAFVNDANVRNPKVLFGQPGEYQAFMALSTPEGVFYDTLAVKVSNECTADSIPGQAVRLGGNDDEGYVALPPFNVSTNTFSVTAWIKSDGIQPEYSSIFMHDGDAAGFNFLPGNNHLGYHWPNGAWWWDSGLEVPSGEWSHVAMVVEPDGITLYLNGIGAKHSFTPVQVDFSAGARLGNYHGWGGRYVKGDLDEVCVYNRSLSQEEIREKMHLRKIPADEANMLAYYQFNEPGGSNSFDRSGTRHGSLVGSATRIASTIALGPGASARNLAVSSGSTTFPGTGITLKFADFTPVPSDEICVTRINLRPDVVPVGDTVSRSYWVARHFGPEILMDGLAEIDFDNIGPAPVGQPADAYQLWQRFPNGEGPVWGETDTPDEVLTGADGSVKFIDPSGLFFGQMILTMPADSLVSDVENPGVANYKTPELRVYPNAVSSGGKVTVFTENLPGVLIFRLFDVKGNPVKTIKFEGRTTFEVGGLAAGTYFYRVDSEKWMQVGALVVGH